MTDHLKRLNPLRSKSPTSSAEYHALEDKERQSQDFSSSPLSLSSENDVQLPPHLSEAERKIRLRYRIIVFSLVALNIVTLVACASRTLDNFRPWRRHILQYQNLMPDFATKLVTFNPDDRYEGFETHHDDAWEHLVPDVVKGYVEISNPIEWGLTGGQPISNGTSPNSELFVVSTFHQLHCVIMLQKTMSKLVRLAGFETHEDSRRLREGRGPISKEAVHAGMVSTVQLHAAIKDPVHLGHCLDLVRQAVQCAGDTVLEHPSHVWEVVHECKDWDQIVGWAAAHVPKGARGI